MMAAVTTIGILSSVAMPSFQRHIKDAGAGRCSNITIKRNHILTIVPGIDLLSPHWWTEFGSMSFGWWPNPDFMGNNLLYAVGGILGTVNGYSEDTGACIFNKDCSPFRDPLHGTPGDIEFNPQISDEGMENGINCQIAEIRALNYIEYIKMGKYKYSVFTTDGMNCRTFQERIMEEAFLVDPPGQLVP
jgi:hypothetical protein